MAARGIPQGGYNTGDMSVSTLDPPLNGRNSAFVSGVSESEPAHTAVVRGRSTAGENQGARLSISPSMKTVDPTGFATPTQANGRLVPPTMGGESRKAFNDQ
jgi:hypothetical protein